MRSHIMAFCLMFCLVSSILPAEEKILKMASLGNSISWGTNAIGIGVFPKYSWSTGTEIESHRIKLEKQRGVKVVAKNVAIVGATSSLLWLQVKALGRFIPDYTTIEIGANDVCRNAHTNIVKNVKRTIDKLLRKNPNMEIVLAPIARISSMYQWGHSIKCKAFWNIECPSFLGSTVSEEKRQIEQIKLDGINYSLYRLSQKYPQVYFNPELGEGNINEEDVSEVDCFHPSVIGQQHFADLTFKD